MNRILVFIALLGIGALVVVIAAGGSPSSASSAVNGLAARRTASVHEIVNIVQARPAVDQAFAQASEGLVVGEGGQVQTQAQSRVRLDFSEGTTVRLGADSLVTVQQLNGAGNDAFSRFFLEGGKLWISVFGGSFTVETPVGVATVRGSFAVFEYDRANDVLTVDCIEGMCTAANDAVDERMGNLEGVVLRRAGRQVTRTALNAGAVQDFVRNSPEGRPVIATLTAAPPATRVPRATDTPAPANTSVPREPAAPPPADTRVLPSQPPVPPTATTARATPILVPRPTETTTPLVIIRPALEPTATPTRAPASSVGDVQPVDSTAPTKTTDAVIVNPTVNTNTSSGGVLQVQPTESTAGRATPVLNIKPTEPILVRPTEPILVRPTEPILIRPTNPPPKDTPQTIKATPSSNLSTSPSGIITNITSGSTTNTTSGTTSGGIITLKTPTK
ncbi:MAG: FecR domain-containing protein [Chloroflexi bacterium]|nr:FecR domain-containing protein [Chloroflexota bacterium]